MDDRLLIPVADLPGPVPAGTSLAYDRADGWWRGVFVGRTLQGVALGVDNSDLHPWTVDGLATPGDLYLDLTPPPLDANGWPTRIDGLDVAAGMLARHYAGVVHGAAWVPYDIGRRTWRLTGLYWSGRLFASLDVYGVYHEQYPIPVIPALADIDPTDVLAPRLAMAACFRARVWEGR